MREFPFRIKLGGLEPEKIVRTDNLVYFNDVFVPLYRFFDYVVVDGATYAYNTKFGSCVCKSGPGLLFYPIDSRGLGATDSITVSASTKYAHVVPCANKNTFYVGMNGTVYEATSNEGSLSLTLTKLVSAPSLVFLYNDSTVVLAGFSSSKSSYWIGSPIGAEVGSLAKVSFAQLSGEEKTTSSDLLQLWSTFTPTFGFLPSGAEITALGQVGGSIAFFTRNKLYLGRFVESELFALDEVPGLFPVSSQRQVYCTGDIVFVLTDDGKFVMVSDKKTDLLFDFGKLKSADPDLPMPSYISDVADDSVILGNDDSVILGNYVFTAGAMFGPVYPTPLGFYVGKADENGPVVKAIVVERDPFDNEEYTEFRFDSGWLFRDVQGLISTNAISFDTVNARNTEVVLEYVPDAESRRKILRTNRIKARNDLPAFVKRTGTNFKVSFSGRLRKDGRVTGAIIRVTFPDARYVRGQFIPDG